MDTDAHGSGFICVHPCSSVVILLSALSRPLITVGSSAWSAEFGVYEPFDAEQGATANPAFAFGFCQESQVLNRSKRRERSESFPLCFLRFLLWTVGLVPQLGADLYSCVARLHFCRSGRAGRRCD